MCYRIEILFLIIYSQQIFIYFSGTENGPYIILKFANFSTECSYDILTVYDGKSFSSMELATLSGETIPSIPIQAKSSFVSKFFLVIQEKKIN